MFNHSQHRILLSGTPKSIPHQALKLEQAQERKGNVAAVDCVTPKYPQKASVDLELGPTKQPSS